MDFSEAFFATDGASRLNRNMGMAHKANVAATRIGTILSGSCVSFDSPSKGVSGSMKAKRMKSSSAIDVTFPSDRASPDAMGCMRGLAA